MCLNAVSNLSISLLFIFLNSCLVFGQDLAQDDTEFVDHITTKFELLEVSDGAISQEDILAGKHDSSFTSIVSNNFFGGNSASVFWLKTNNSRLNEKTRIIELDKPYLTSVNLFFVDAERKIDSTHNGMIVPYDERTIQSGRIAFRLPQTEKSIVYYIQIQSNNPIAFDIIAFSEKSWEQSEKNYNIILIIFITLFSLVAIASILFGLMFRQFLFLFYLGFVFFFGVAVLHNFGFIKELFEFSLSAQIVPTSVSFSLFSLLGIFWALLSMSEKPYLLMKKYIKIGMGLFILLGSVYALMPDRWLISIIFILLPILLIVLVISSIFLKKEGEKGIKLFMVGCSLLLMAFTVHLINIFGVTSLPVFMKLIPFFFLIATMIFFLLGFIYQSNLHKEVLIRTEQNLKKTLEDLEFYRRKLRMQMPSDSDDGIINDTHSPETTPNMDVADLNKVLVTRLSERELDVLGVIAEGNTNDQVAESLFISVNTVKTHLSRIYEKLEVNNRTEAAIKASRMNLLK